MQIFPEPSPEKKVFPSEWAQTEHYKEALFPIPSLLVNEASKNLIPLLAALINLLKSYLHNTNEIS